MRVYVFYSIPNDIGFLFFLLIFLSLIYLFIELINMDIKKRHYEKIYFTNQKKKYYEISGTQIVITGIVYIITTLTSVRYISNMLMKDFKNDNTFLQLIGWSLILFGWAIPLGIFKLYNYYKNYQLK